MTVISGLVTSVNILKSLVRTAEWKTLKCRLMLEVAMEGVFKLLLTQAPS